MSNSRRQIYILAAVQICLLLDLGSKYWAHNCLQSGERQIFIPGLINLTLTSNTGFAFSIGQGHKLMTPFIAVAVFLGLLIVYIQRYLSLSYSPANAKQQKPWLEQLGMAVIIGAAAGNLFERLYHGKVTDFFEFAFMNFPVFNVADVLIDTGIGLILISAYCSKKGFW